MTWLAETAMLSHGWRRFLIVLAAGALAGLSVPPLFILPALFVALPVWVWCLDGAEPGRGLRRVFGPAFSIGFGFGLGYFTVAFHWLGAAFLLEGGIMIAVMPFAIVALAALIALFWGLGSALAHLLWSPGPWRVVTLASAITTAEFARGHLFSGFPFDLLGYALTADEAMMQLSAVVGVYGLTLLVLLVAMTPALIWPGAGRGLVRRLAPFAVALLVLAGQFGWGSLRLGGTAVSARTDIRMRLVQPMIAEHADWQGVDPPAIVDRLIALSENRTGPDDPGLPATTHLVWPESSLPFYLSQYPDIFSRVGRMLPPGTTLLAGAPRQPLDAGGEISLTPRDPEAGEAAFNSILAINTDGEVIASYDKSHLVPFGEFLPFPHVFASIGLGQFVPGASGWTPGEGRRLLSLPQTPPFLALICYEAIFSGDLGSDVGAAAFLFNITNDGWFDGSIGPAQHAHHARLRAVEEGMALVRAANTGVTMLVDPLGRVTASLPAGQEGLIDVSPANRLAPTPFAQWRHWPLLVVLVLLAVVSVLAARRGRGPARR